MTESRSKRNKPGRSSQAIAAILAGVIISLGLAEIAVRLILPHPSFFLGHPGNVPGLVSSHPERGYSWTAGFDGVMTTQDFSNRYLISNQGLRDDVVKVQDEYRILTVGDSFTGGEGVNAEQTWPKQLQTTLNARELKSTPVRVINAGVTGYGARQMRLMTEEFVPRFNPEIVIMAVYSLGLDRIDNEFALYGDHLVRSRDLPDMTPYKDGFIWYRSTLSSPLLSRLDLWSQRYAHFPAYLFKTAKRYGVFATMERNDSGQGTGTVRSEIDALSSELAATARYLSTQQIEFVVMIVNQQEKDGSFSDRGRQASDQIRDLCRALDILCIDPVVQMRAMSNDGISMRFENDAHWSPAAHAVAAKILADALGVDP